MKSVVKFFDELPLIVKIILALPVLDGICWGIYRICKGHIFAGLVWILVGTVLTWLVDLITLCVYHKVSVFAE